MIKYLYFITIPVQLFVIVYLIGYTAYQAVSMPTFDNVIIVICTVFLSRKYLKVLGKWGKRYAASTN